MNELALFAGIGGGIYGSRILGWNTVCAVEIEEYRRKVILQRQRDGIFELFPIWKDIKTFNGKPWRGKIDILTGGFPCQDISVAGKGEGINGKKSGLWFEMDRVISEVRPKFVFVENSPMLIKRGLGAVLSCLAKIGYDAVWGCFRARDAGAPHKRERIFILAYSDKIGLRKNLQMGNVKEKGKREEGNVFTGQDFCPVWQGGPPGSGVLRVDHGVSDWRKRIASCGDAQVPAVVATAFNYLKSKIMI